MRRNGGREWEEERIPVLSQGTKLSATRLPILSLSRRRQSRVAAYYSRDTSSREGIRFFGQPERHERLDYDYPTTSRPTYRYRPMIDRANVASSYVSPDDPRLLAAHVRFASASRPGLARGEVSVVVAENFLSARRRRARELGAYGALRHTEKRVLSPTQTAICIHRINSFFSSRSGH